jgi:hypothetical protein
MATGRNIHEATTIPARVMTIACQIGKHFLCKGEGTHEDTGETVACECECHRSG